MCPCPHGHGYGDGSEPFLDVAFRHTPRLAYGQPWRGGPGNMAGAYRRFSNPFVKGENGYLVVVSTR